MLRLASTLHGSFSESLPRSPFFRLVALALPLAALAALAALALLFARSLSLPVLPAFLLAFAFAPGADPVLEPLLALAEADVLPPRSSNGADSSSLTDEQLKSLGFVSLIIPKAELKAVAFIDNKNQQTEIMTKVKTWIAEGFATLRKELKLPVAEVKTDAKAEVLTDSNGVSIYTDKPIADFVTDQNTGIKVFSDEAMTVPMVDGEFEANGYKITVAGGMVTAVETSMTPEEEMALLKAENEALKQENANARAEFEAALTEQIENLKADIGSAYVPKGEVKRFVTTKQTTAPVATVKKSVKEEVAERKAQYKTTKK